MKGIEWRFHATTPKSQDFLDGLGCRHRLRIAADLARAEQKKRGEPAVGQFLTEKLLRGFEAPVIGLEVPGLIDFNLDPENIAAFAGGDYSDVPGEVGIGYGRGTNLVGSRVVSRDNIPAGAVPTAAQAVLDQIPLDQRTQEAILDELQKMRAESASQKRHLSMSSTTE